LKKNIFEKEMDSAIPKGANEAQEMMISTSVHDLVPTITTTTTPTATSTTRLQLGAIIRKILFPALHLAWLAPVITLLVLNLQNYIVGSSFGCLNHNCLINPFASNVTQVTSHLAYIDRNVLGSLQLVAKALEIWFLLIAGGLVYDLLMLLARRGNGLPLGYLLAHKEFSDASSFGMSFWTAPIPEKNNISGGDRGNDSKPTTSKFTLYAFAILVTLLCVIANLMGPSTAVLLLPTLERVQILNQNPSVFLALEAGDPPSSIQNFQSYGPLNVSCYDCNNKFYQILDSMVADAFIGNSITVQTDSGVEYSLNTTNYTANLIWAPSRQTLIDLSFDALQYNYVNEDDSLTDAQTFFNETSEVLTPSLFKTYRSSIDVQVQRDGPVIGFLSQCMIGNTSVIPIAEDKLVRCYTSWPSTAEFWPGPIYPYSDPDQGISTKCIRVGSGWTGARNDYAQFFITNLNSQPANKSQAQADNEGFATASVNIYSVANAIFLNASTSYCSTPINNQSNPTCDWDTLFSETPSPQYQNYSLSQQITEYVYPNITEPFVNSTGEYIYNPHVYGYTTNWCWSVAFLSFGTYALDLSSPANSIATLSSVNSISPTADPIYVHPDWTLLSWSVNQSAFITPNMGGEAIYDLFTAWSLEYVNLTDAIHAAITASTLSIINYDQRSDSASSANNTLNPILTAYSTAQVWAYGLSSATSKLGFATGVLGCLTVCFAVALGIGTRTTKREFLELFTTALKQKPPERLVGLPSEQVEKVRFMLENKEDAEFEFKTHFVQ
jgi:hypothetical protein